MFDKNPPSERLRAELDFDYASRRRKGIPSSTPFFILSAAPSGLDTERRKRMMTLLGLWIILAPSDWFVAMSREPTFTKVISMTSPVGRRSSSGEA